MAKLKIRTTDATVYTKAKELDMPFQRRSDYEVEFVQEIADKLVIDLGYEISTSGSVLLPYIGLSEDEVAAMFAAVGFQAPAFLQNYKAKMTEHEEENKQAKLKREIEKEAEQRRDIAKKQARELLADEIAKLNAEITSLKEKLERKDNRISDLESYLHKLIMQASEPALERAGLVKPQTEAEEEEPTPEQQEALETADLDC